MREVCEFHRQHDYVKLPLHAAGPTHLRMNLGHRKEKEEED
jgi:hypothetical protein